MEWELRTRLAKGENAPEITLELLSTSALVDALLAEELQFIVTDFPLENDLVVSTGFFMEQLYLSVPPDHPYTMQKEISLDDLSDLTMLLRSDLGIWQPLVDRLSKTKFIVQKDWDAFEELVSASSLPSFSTNITQSASENNTQRTHIPISDIEATKTFYLSVLKKNRAILAQLTQG